MGFSSRHFKFNITSIALIPIPAMKSIPSASQQMQSSSQYPQVSGNSSDLPLFLPEKNLLFEPISSVAQNILNLSVLHA